MADSPLTATLLISCRDQKGLVAVVSDFLYRNNGNIIRADQHTDTSTHSAGSGQASLSTGQEDGVFLQRVEWELLHALHELRNSSTASQSLGGGRFFEALIACTLA